MITSSSRCSRSSVSVEATAMVPSRLWSGNGAEAYFSAARTSGSELLFHQLAQLLQTPAEQPAHGRLAAIHLLANVLNRVAMHLLQLQRQPLILGQLGQRCRQLQQLFLADGAFAGRR